MGAVAVLRVAAVDSQFRRVPGTGVELARLCMARADLAARQVHANLLVDGERVSVEDASTNGVFVNGERVSKEAPRELHENDVISALRVRWQRHCCSSCC